MSKAEVVAGAEETMEEVVEVQDATDESAQEAVVEGSEEVVGEAQSKIEKIKDDRAGIVHIYSTFNNTMVHITDLGGNTISRVSGGLVTKQSRLKANPTTAMFVAKRAAERARDVGITSLYVRTRAQTGATGTGPGGHAAVKQLGKEGFRIISVVDVTRLPRGGPKKKGGKRGRRV